MASFEPTIIIYGSVPQIAAAQFRLPISFSFTFDVKTLEELINVSPALTDIQLKRFFVILLDAVQNDVAAELEKNHRVVSVYYSDRFLRRSQSEINRRMNSFQQLSLDVTKDIIQFLTLEGQKQVKFERTALASIYFKQARVLREWAMSSFRAEPCHILLVPLNSTSEKMDEVQQRLESRLADSPVIVRQLNDYIPQPEQFSSLLPYAKHLFEYEKPTYLLRLIEKLSPIRLYVYGNQLTQLREWNQLMIENEQSVMDDEDNWCAFLESEPLHDEVKWNFAFALGKSWKVNRVSPISEESLFGDPRFHSAVLRALRTFAERQMEVTAQIFDWYDECLKLGDFHPEPRLSDQIVVKKQELDPKESLSSYRFRDLSFFDYAALDQVKSRSIVFLWLDEMLSDCPTNLHQAIQPARWNFFTQISVAVAFIETQLRERKHIFLVTSGTLGQQFFSTPFSLKNQIHCAYVYCAHLQPNLRWSEEVANIRGVFNDSVALAERLRVDRQQLESQWVQTEAAAPLPLTIYDLDQIQHVLAHQRTIDNLLCMPHNDQSKAEMIDEFRRVFHDDAAVLAEVEIFAGTYHSYAAVQWYTRDSFVWRTLNQVLRNSDAEAMFRFRCILTDIYSHLNESYYQRRRTAYHQRTEMFYRGQLMSNEEFERFQSLRGSIISINTFLSTTSSMQIALLYAGKYFDSDETVSVVFSIETDLQQRTRPYASISPYSLFPDEDETLFAMGSIFRIGNIRLLADSENIWLIHLKMISQTDCDR